MNGKNSIVAQAARFATRKGMLVVNAAGNNGDDNWKIIGTPADVDSVLTVGGISPKNDYHIKFSSYGPNKQMQMKPNVCAYGHAAVARNGNKCITTGTCDYCPTNARYTALYDLVQLQMKYEERLSLHTESPVTKILMDGQKRAIGVDFLDLETGNEESMEADSVVISSGTIESAKLLLASANRDWQTGIGNHSDHLGRHLVGHPLMFAEGVRSGNPNKFNSELGFTSLLSRHFDSPEYQSKGKMWFSPKIGSGTTIERGILSNMSRADIDEWQTEMQIKPMRVGNIHLYTDGLSDEDLAITGVNSVVSVEQAVADSVQQFGDSRIAIIPEGPYVIPSYIS